MFGNTIRKGGLSLAFFAVLCAFAMIISHEQDNASFQASE